MAAAAGPIATPRRVLIIANPGARGMRRPALLDRVVAALRRRGCPVTVRYGDESGRSVEDLAREAESEFDVVVAAGGDGTINAIVNGRAAAPPRSPPVALAVVPLGTVNLLAREIGLSRDAEGLAEIIAAAPARPIWPGRIGSRLFAVVASSGIDADIVAAVDPRRKRRIGRCAFVLAFVGRLWHYRPRQHTVVGDGVTYRAAAVIAAKGRHYAGPFVLAPAASIALPALDLVLLHRSGRLAALRYAAAMVLGRLARRHDVTVLRCREATMSVTPPGPVEIDGEVLDVPPVVTIGVAETPLPLLWP